LGIWIVLTILAFVPFVGLIMIPIHLVVALGFLILWLITIIQAFQGKKFVIPIIGGLAQKQAGGA
jgi:uncharacterized membrane protein